MIDFYEYFDNCMHGGGDSPPPIPQTHFQFVPDVTGMGDSIGNLYRYRVKCLDWHWL